MIEVLRFAELMERELIANSHKTGWSELSPVWLLNRLRQETKELESAIATGKVDLIASEAADVANFAMMIVDNAGGLRKEGE